MRRNKESLDNNYILLTNSHMVEDRAGAILNVSTAHQMSQVSDNKILICFMMMNDSVLFLV